MAVKSVRSPSFGTSSTLVDIPLPSLSITNKPSTGTSLYHTCRSVLDKLSLVEGMTFYLECESSSSSILSSESATSNDPLTKLWELCRKGAPLATLFNSLNPIEPLKVDSNITMQTNECKKAVYHFIVACRNQLNFSEDDLFTLSDLFKDNTNGFVKVVNTINLILNLLEEKGIIACSNSTNRNSMNEPKDTRDKVVNELLETERKYVQDLEILQNYMRELQIQEILNPDTIHYLFGNLNTLVDFQRRFLIQLEEIGERPGEEQNFGSLFKLQEKQFTVYEPYCSNYFSAQYLVQQETPKLQKLADILNPEYELPSMLIKPVQRICKYPLLLHQLIKATNSDWPHFEEMQQGLDAVKRITERVNETQRKHENIKIVDELKRRVDELRSSQIDQYGSLLLHEKLFIRHEDENEKELFVYFFEKTMLLCKESKDATKNKANISIKKKRRGSLLPRGLIVMNRVLNVRNLSTGEGNWSLRVDWKDSEVNHAILRFRNEEQVKLWESTLRRTMSPQKSNVSNTQLASMKNLTEHLPPNFRDEEDEETEDSETQEEDVDYFEQQTRSRSNSLSAHLLNTISGRPKIPRNMSVDQTNTIKRVGPIPRSSSSANTHNHHEFYYPVSPPPSNPSSPTTSSRVTTPGTTTRDSSPLIDIATKFMASGLVEEDYIPPPPPILRSQSHSTASPGHFPPTTQQQLLFQQQRIRSQSSPNIHHGWEDHLQHMPTFNSRTLQTPPSPLESPPSVKIKLNYNDGIYAVTCSTDILYFELIEKVERKIRIVSNLQPHDILRLKYQDEDGDLITINSDEDVQMAFESRGNLNTINLFVSI